MAGEQDIQRLTASVRGYVQGVGYRYYVLQHARALGLTGFARNEPDDSVTVVAEGPTSLLAGLIEALRRGPEGADVQDIQHPGGRQRGSSRRFVSPLHHRADWMLS